MNTRSIAALMALLRQPGAGNTTARRAVAIAQSLKVPLDEFADLAPSELAQRLPGADLDGLTPFLARCDQAALDNELRLLDRVYAAGAQAIACCEEDYPESLACHLGLRAPALLFAAGNLGLLETPSVAIVGAREVSMRGSLLASDCAKVFAGHSVTVVSGGAPGVDSAAHSSALANGGATVIVLPQGLLTFQGPRDSMEALDEGRALAVSEFLPDAIWQTHAAVTRNATISALARMVCVIEPKKTGGSVRTARCAIEQGKRVLAYYAPGFADLERTLSQAGASRLLDAEGQFSEDHILGLWQSAPNRPSGQAELF
ncbi:MAG: DNA-processing protein DprA [Candidatus Hydrogenedentes bacterium]|nr:DNA-processing protein DprA [Candidatus Hydrogenedentota bacterium]